MPRNRDKVTWRKDAAPGEGAYDWMKRAGCLGVKPQHMFLGQEHQRDMGIKKDRRLVNEAIAKTVCSTCEVQQTCLEWALKHGEIGVWGGTNDDDRFEMLMGYPRGKGKGRRRGRGVRQFRLDRGVEEDGMGYDEQETGEGNG